MVTLQYLATGETFSFLESQFCFSRTAISEIILRKVIWQINQKILMNVGE